MSEKMIFRWELVSAAIVVKISRCPVLKRARGLCLSVVLLLSAHVATASVTVFVFGSDPAIQDDTTTGSPDTVTAEFTTNAAGTAIQSASFAITPAGGPTYSVPAAVAGLNALKVVGGPGESFLEVPAGSVVDIVGPVAGMANVTAAINWSNPTGVTTPYSGVVVNTATGTTLAEFDNPTNFTSPWPQAGDGSWIIATADPPTTITLPEPGTLTIFSVLLGLGVVYVWRRGPKA